MAIWKAQNNLVDNWQELNETNPAVEETIVTGWIVGTGTTNRSELSSGVERAAATFTSTTPPDGTLDTVLFDAFRTTDAYTGDFAAGDWEAHIVVRAIDFGGGHDGQAYVRLIKADADGGNATEITGAAQACTQVNNVGTGSDFDSDVTFAPGAFSITNQYIFLQTAWARIGAGGMAGSDVHIRVAATATRLVSTTFTPAADDPLRWQNTMPAFVPRRPLVVVPSGVIPGKGRTADRIAALARAYRALKTGRRAA